MFDDAFADDSQAVGACSSCVHVYGARDLMESIPEFMTVWQVDPLLSLYREYLGDSFGLGRALFFDKSPERSWNLNWHKDTTISVKHNASKLPSLWRPTIITCVPRVIASDEAWRQIMTLKIHLEEVTDENGPIRVIP